MSERLSTESKYKHLQNGLLLLAVCLIAYWPLTFSEFSVKNDAIHYFLPFRYNIVENLRNGELPLWSPYIYLGFPVSGDMQSGAWNPVVWFLAILGKYTLTTFHFENLLYIYVASIGMYKLTNYLFKDRKTSLVLAMSYMLCGFMLNGQLINWLAAAAIIPFVLLYYLRLLAEGKKSDGVKTGVALYLLLTAGYPSFLLITGYLLFLLFFIKGFDLVKNQKKGKEWQQFLTNHLLLIVVFIGLSLPAILSFFDLIPYYSRGSGVDYNNSITNSLELKYLLSLLFPSSINGQELVTKTDITFRNMYLGIVPLILLLALPPKLTRRNILLIFLALFSLLFSLGDLTPIRKICYDFIPLMNSFRHPVQLKLFFTIAILLLAGPAINQLVMNTLKPNQLNRVKKIVGNTIFLLFAAILLSFFKLKNSTHGLLKNGPTIDSIKSFLGSQSVYEGIIINGLIQLASLFLMYLWLKKWKTKSSILIGLTIANMIILAQFILPLSFVGSTPPSEINSFIKTSPKGFPVNQIEKTLKENSKDATTSFNRIALSLFYNKKIGLTQIANNPTSLKDYSGFLSSSPIYNLVLSLPVVYLADTTLTDFTILINSLSKNRPAYITNDIMLQEKSPTDTVVTKRISGNHFEFETNIENEGLLVLSQNYHKAWKAKIDGQLTDIYKTNISFMSCKVPAGKHSIEFTFRPSYISYAVIIQMVVLLNVLLFFALTFRKTR